MSTTRVGRPPDRKIGDSLIAAAHRLWTEADSPTLTVEAVTAMAGTTRPSFYRRFSSLGALAMEVLEAHLDVPSFAPTDDLLTDLLAVRGAVSDICASPLLLDHGADIAAYVQSSPELGARWRAHLPSLFADQVSAIMSAHFPAHSPSEHATIVGVLTESMVDLPLTRALFPTLFPSIQLDFQNEAWTHVVAAVTASDAGTQPPMSRR